MPLISREDAHQVISPYFGDFEHIFRTAWRDWMHNPSAPRMQTKTFRANFVWDTLQYHAKAQFLNRQGIVASPLGSCHGVLVDGRIFIKLKKANERLLSSNIPTQMALAFHDQEEDLFDGIVRLEVVYVLSKDETELEKIVLLQRHQQNILWSIDIRSQAMEQLEPFVMPLPAPSGGSVADRILRPHGIEKETEERYAELGAGKVSS